MMYRDLPMQTELLTSICEESGISGPLLKGPLQSVHKEDILLVLPQVLEVTEKYSWREL